MKRDPDLFEMSLAKIAVVAGFVILAFATIYGILTSPFRKTIDPKEAPGNAIGLGFFTLILLIGVLLTNNNLVTSVLVLILVPVFWMSLRNVSAILKKKK